MLLFSSMIKPTVMEVLMSEGQGMPLSLKDKENIKFMAEAIEEKDMGYSKGSGKKKFAIIGIGALFIGLMAALAGGNDILPDLGNKSDPTGHVVQNK